LRPLQMASTVRKNSDVQSSLGELHRAPSPARSDLAFSSLGEIGERSKVLLEKKKTSRFFDKGKDAQEVANLVEELRNAIVYYQVSGNHVVETRVDINETGVTTTIDIQPDRRTDCKISHQSYLRPQC